MRSEKQYTHLFSVEKALEFEKILREKGFVINSKSDLYRIGFDALNIYEKNENNELYIKGEDIRPETRRVLGFIDFINKVLPLVKSDYYESILPHLKLLNKSSIPQTVNSKITDQGSNKLFELYTAALCYPDFEKIVLDSPENSKGDNPDVMFENNGAKFGIACKVLHSDKPKTIFDNISKAVSQIEQSECENGIVFLSLRNLIDYDVFWSTTPSKDLNSIYYNNDINSNISTYRLENFVMKIFYSLAQNYRVELSHLFNGMKASPAILCFAQAVTGIIKNGNPVFARIGYLGKINIGLRIPKHQITFEIIEKIEKKLN
jgi:hypothetical protein